MINLALQLQGLGRSEEAILLYERAIADAPRLEFYVNLRWLWISAKQPQRTVPLLQKAIELAPDCIPAHVNLAGKLDVGTLCQRRWPASARHWKSNQRTSAPSSGLLHC